MGISFEKDIGPVSAHSAIRIDELLSTGDWHEVRAIDLEDRSKALWQDKCHCNQAGNFPHVHDNQQVDERSTISRHVMTASVTQARLWHTLL